MWPFRALPLHSTAQVTSSPTACLGCSGAAFNRVPTCRTGRTCRTNNGPLRISAKLRLQRHRGCGAMNGHKIHRLPYHEGKQIPTIFFVDGGAQVVLEGPGGLDGGSSAGSPAVFRGPSKNGVLPLHFRRRSCADARTDSSKQRSA
jgi:hypothetical protein